MTKTHLFLATAAFVLPTPLLAQHQGHTMPAEPAATATKPVDHSTMDHSQHQQAPAPQAPAQQPADHSTMDHSTMDHSTMDHGQHHQAPATKPVDHGAMNHGAMDHSSMQHGSAGAEGHDGMVHEMTGALGAYPMAREASGTAWQPDTATHGGIHAMSGDWSFMLHGNLDLIHSTQGGPRGDDKTFVAGMVMGTARRPLGNGTLQFRGMLSPDPLMGKTGYPLLLASGETADGVEHLVDRQHPHDFFMELSASISQQIAPKTSVFLYGGLPGEPAFGPPAFMHRQSINVSPEAPITHHWLDSTHITFGVLTAGLIHDRFKVEVSRFNAREPDQYRWNIETGPLDSTAVRLSWNPTRTLALQGSWGRFKSPEQLEPGVNQKRWSASGTWTVPLGDDMWSSTTLAWGRKVVEGNKDDAFALESSLGWKRWTLFARAEQTENRELVEDDHHDDAKVVSLAAEGHGAPAYKVGKVSIGALYELPVARHLKLGIGGLYAFNFVPEAIEHEYGGDPKGAMGFLRLKID